MSISERFARAAGCRLRASDHTIKETISLFGRAKAQSVPFL